LVFQRPAPFFFSCVMASLSAMLLVILLALAHAQDPFRNWLSNITIEIPEISQIVKEGLAGTYNITLTTFICKGLDFNQIQSNYQPPLSLSLSMDGIQIACHGKWDWFEVSHPSSISGEGTVTGSVGNSAVDLGIVLVEDTYGLATSATVSKMINNIQFTELKFSGGLIADVLEVISSLFKKSIEKEIDKELTKVITTLINKNLTKALSHIDNLIRPYLNATQPDPTPPVSEGTMNLVNNSLIRLLDFLVDDKLGAKGLNRVMDVLTKGTGIFSRSHINHSLVSINMSAGHIEFGISDFSISGLDSWSDFNLFVPADNYSLVTRTAMEMLAVNITFYVNVSAKGHVSGGGSLYEKARFSMRLAHNTLQGRMLLALSESVVSSLSGLQFLEAGCICSAIKNINFTQFILNTTVQDIRLESIGGGSEKDLDQAIDNIIALFTHSFGSAIPAFLNGIIVGPLRTYVNEAIATMISNTISTKSCSSISTTSSVNSMTIVAPASGAMAAFVLIILIAFRFSKSKSKSSKSLEEDTPLLPVNDTPALVMHPGLSRLARFGVPFLICCNIALFIFSNTNVGASVYIALSVGGSSTRLPDLFQFDLANSVRDMWSAGVYPLSLLIATFSGAWPYLKLLIMMYCWLMPGRYLGERRREGIFMFVDALGKWSLMDSYIMVLMLVAFRFHVGSPKESSTAMDVFVEPGVGIHTFVGATMLSLILTHLCLALHRYVTASHRILSLNIPQTEALSKHHLQVAGRTGSWTLLGRFSIPFLLAFSAATMCSGAVIESFNFVFQGAAALVLELLNVDTSTPYSLLSLGNKMPNSSANPNDFGVRFLQATFFTFAFCVPLAHVLSLLVLWLVPFTLRAQHKLYVAVEVFNAWAALDVFVVAIIAALLEVEQFAQFIIGDKCDGINVLLAEFFDKALDGHDKCFDVVATLAKGCWVLFGAVVVSTFCSILVMRTCHSALTERTRVASLTHSVNLSDESEKDVHKPCSCCSRVSLLCFHLGFLKDVSVSGHSV